MVGKPMQVILHMREEWRRPFDGCQDGYLAIPLANNPTSVIKHHRTRKLMNVMAGDTFFVARVQGSGEHSA
jgi:hypothetical protein